ncbi:MAG TPA: hypothetical protein VEB21_00835, partial [Terriglobales bacterium]|nr:hypothetical protein [Terriglobales bacterium]
MLGRGLLLMVAADFAGFGRDTVAGSLVRGGALTRQQFRQRQESDADRYALWLLHRSGGRVEGAFEFLRALEGPVRPLTHFDDSPTAAQARRRAMQKIIREEGWQPAGEVGPVVPGDGLDLPVPKRVLPRRQKRTSSSGPSSIT